MLITLLTLVCVMGGGVQSAAEERQNAAALWASAIAAKGGRDRLAGIRSFAVLEKTPSKVDQIVCELPDLWWEFLDYRPLPLGVSVRVLNARTGRGWASHGGAARPFLQPDTHTPYRMRQLQYVYFLETRSVRPAPQRARRVQLGSRAADLVETLVDGEPVDFYLDPDTHLPSRIEARHTIVAKPPRPGLAAPRDQEFVYELADYHAVAGVQVPGRVTLGGARSEVRVEINPQFNPAIFTQPPSPEAGIDVWRRRD